MLYERVKLNTVALVFFFFFGGAALGSLLGLLGELLGSVWAMVLFVIPTVMGVIAAIIVSQDAIRWPYPRCRKPFHATFWGHRVYVSRCLHCKLPKWAPGPDAG